MLPEKEQKLERGLSLTQATAINMIDMVGIGPFVTLPLITGMMHGSAALLAWLLGALLAYTDGMVWAELGAKYPEAGGSYVFLQKLFGEAKWGKLMAFLFIWQTVIQAPLVIASGAIGFSKYFAFLVPLDDNQRRMTSGGLVILLVALLYRNIKSIGKISVALWFVTGSLIIWLIFSGFGKFHSELAFDMNLKSFDSSVLLFAALGHASLKSVYSYLGYYNVCHLGAEIKDPGKNIPRSIVLSITGIAILYISMQIMISGVMPWQEIAGSEHIVSVYFERVYGSHLIATVATWLILLIALASLFSAILGYSRIPYAAAKNGDFFKVFARVHPKYKFPHVSLIAIGGLAFIISVTCSSLGNVITAIVMMRILIQFVSQAVGLIAWHYKKPKDGRPYKMPLFPLPAITSILIWMFIFFSSDWIYIAGSLGIIVTGLIIYFVREKYFKPEEPIGFDSI